jgi:acyl carrier protein
MTPNEKLTKLIYNVIDEINTQLSDDQQLEKTTITSLYDDGGGLDSLGLVQFVVAVEQGVRDIFGVSLTLVTERAMSQQHSPFKTVQSLIDFIIKLLEENGYEENNNT